MSPARRHSGVRQADGCIPEYLADSAGSNTGGNVAVGQRQVFSTSIRSSGFQCFWVYSMVNALLPVCSVVRRQHGQAPRRRSFQLAHAGT